MNYHELKKDAKIVDEILLYLLKNNDDDISIDISRNEDKIIFSFKISKLSKEALSYMDKYINKEREIEVEEYGWELMGESGSQSDLGMVGLLIDKMSILEEDNHTVLKLIRYYKKK